MNIPIGVISVVSIAFFLNQSVHAMQCASELRKGLAHNRPVALEFATVPGLIRAPNNFLRKKIRFNTGASIAPFNQEFVLATPEAVSKKHSLQSGISSQRKNRFPTPGIKGWSNQLQSSKKIAIDPYEENFLEMEQQEMASLLQKVQSLEQAVKELEHQKKDMTQDLVRQEFARVNALEVREQQDPLFQAGLLSFQKGNQSLDSSVCEPTVEELKSEIVNPRFERYQVRSKIFRPSLKDEKILFLSIHGTFSDEQSFGANENKQTSQALYESAKKLAIGHQKAVELATFTWSGALNAADRKEAAQVLAEYVNNKRVSDTTIQRVIIFAHSHGCNVALAAAENMKSQVDVAFLAACPDTDITFDDPHFDQVYQYQQKTFNIGTVVHCYGLHDVTQIAGSLQNKGTKTRKLPLRINDEHKVYNVKLTADGNELNHINIKYHLARQMHELFFCIATYLPSYFDLIANVSSTHEKPLVAIRHAQVSDAPDRLLSAANEAMFEKIYGRNMQQKVAMAIRMVQAPLDEFQTKGAGL